MIIPILLHVSFGYYCQGSAYTQNGQRLFKPGFFRAFCPTSSSSLQASRLVHLPGLVWEQKSDEMRSLECDQDPSSFPHPVLLVNHDWALNLGTALAISYG